MTERLIETYRGVAIERTSEVVGFRVRPEQAVCIQIHFRREDDAPILDMFRTVEEAREAIDEDPRRGHFVMPRPSLMDRPSASFDAVSRRALAKWCAMKARDAGDILRMHQKAAGMREAREMNAFLDTLRRPHDAKRWRLIQATERNSTSTRTLEQA